MLTLVLASFLLVNGIAIDAARLLRKPTPTVQNTCPPGVLSAVNSHYLQVKDGVCFHFAVYDRKMYREASVICHKDGGTLALPKTAALNNFLTNQTRDFYSVNEDVWIGLHDKKDEGTFVWEDQKPLNWHNFKPGNGPASNWFVRHFEDCVGLDPNDGFWYDFPCNNALLSAALGSDPRKMYICQY